jgi:hypothetical protein
VAEAELKDIQDQLLNAGARRPDAAETARLRDRKAEAQARLDEQAIIEEEATALLESAELRAAGTVKEPVSIRRAAFDAMTPEQRIAHFKEGGTIVDPPKIMKSPSPLPAGGMRRADFDKLGASQQMAHIKAGGGLVD